MSLLFKIVLTLYIITTIGIYWIALKLIKDETIIERLSVDNPIAKFIDWNSPLIKLLLFVLSFLWPFLIPINSILNLINKK